MIRDLAGAPEAGPARRGARPQNTALGQGAEASVADPVARNPVAANSFRHSSPERSGDDPRLSHQPSICPNTISQNALGSGSAARNAPPGARRSAKSPN